MKTEINLFVKVPVDVEVSEVTLDPTQREKIQKILLLAPYQNDSYYNNPICGERIYFGSGEFNNDGIIVQQGEEICYDHDGRYRYIMGKVFIHLKVRGGKHQAYPFNAEQSDAISMIFQQAIGHLCIAIGLGGLDGVTLFYNFGKHIFDVVESLRSGQVSSPHVKMTSKKKILLVSYDISQIVSQVYGEGVNLERYTQWLSFFRACQDYFDFVGIEYKVIRGLGNWLVSGTTIEDNDLLDMVQKDMAIQRQTYGSIPESAEASVTIKQFLDDWHGPTVTMLCYSEVDEDVCAIDVLQHVRASDNVLIEEEIKRVETFYLNVKKETLLLEDDGEELESLIDLSPTLSAQKKLNAT